ncbi:MAG: hypothetical protein NZ901_09400 [Geminocystis sp.]|nr:hypothetical protein [Geminocystis sp.]HIK38884.1 hypothetical protein [Geminocystis sp. M7585_C2015_104]MCS7148390.1 hypothetical protein [Geminocystis sp.]MCX8078295.1 hypothetical protein [Geminocystis sp.]MDW8116021.1 Sll0314/Alr1548 family TPR repeat-containing protein [Geminocystis sp.]
MPFFSPLRHPIHLRLLSVILTLSSLLLVSNSSLAGDPFRTTNRRNISDETEAAFRILFEEGNYPLAKQRLVAYLDKNNTNNRYKVDPLATALLASLAYTENNWEALASFAQKTIDNAKSLASVDPLRSNLYLAVGNFLMGASVYQIRGPIAALERLQLVLDYLDRAKKIDPQDPELNLIQGYLNLFLALKLPFSSPRQAIADFQSYAAPSYLVNRGIAIAYRDLKEYDLALVFVDKALQATPSNPELYYLKGQILRAKGTKENNINLLQEALRNFEIALSKKEQLPLESARKPLEREWRKTKEKITELSQKSG